MGCARYMASAILSEKKYETKFMMAAKTRAINMPRWPPKARPATIGSKVIAVSRSAVLKILLIREAQELDACGGIWALGSWLLALRARFSSFAASAPGLAFGPARLGFFRIRPGKSFPVCAPVPTGTSRLSGLRAKRRIYWRRLRPWPELALAGSRRAQQPGQQRWRKPWFAAGRRSLTLPCLRLPSPSRAGA